MDISAIAVPKNESDIKKLESKTKPRGRKKVIKEDDIIEDQLAVAESTSVPKRAVSNRKEEKRDTKLAQTKSNKAKKDILSNDKLKNFDTDVKPPDPVDQSVEPVKEEIRKTRRRGWWSKSS